MVQGSRAAPVRRAAKKTHSYKGRRGLLLLALLASCCVLYRTVSRSHTADYQQGITRHADGTLQRNQPFSLEMQMSVESTAVTSTAASSVGTTVTDSVSTADVIVDDAGEADALRAKHQATLLHSVQAQQETVVRPAAALSSHNAQKLYAGLVDEGSVDVSDMPPDWLSTEPGSTERTTNQFAPQEWQRMLWRSVKAALLTRYWPPEPTEQLPYYAGDSAHLASLPGVLQQRCRGTVGDWCGRFDLQEPLPPKAPPHGRLQCPHDCNGVGVCQADFGYCLCPAGWTGEGCTVRQLRPCAHQSRAAGWQPATAAGLPIGQDGWTESRCGGVCNEDTGACFCNGTYGHVPPPPGSPPGTLPLQMGRAMMLSDCSPARGDDGRKNDWGAVDNAALFGNEGWCEAPKPAFSCNCLIDGFGGELCTMRYEMSCSNQCAGHGECWLGFCSCHPGYYGTDCAQRAEGQIAEPGLEVTTRPWLKPVIAAPAAADPPALLQRRRPLIYVYDLPPDYNTRILQYRNAVGMCFHRKFHDDDNSTVLQLSGYTIETALHEMLQQSEHRTFDPDEADFFYMPIYLSCLLNPVAGYADHPWYWGPGGPRVMQGTHMLLEAKWWLEAHMPRYWRRRGGRDHIWLMPHDEGACWAPTEIWSGIFLSHWGRRDHPHASGTAYRADNYSDPYEPPFRGWAPHDWRHLIANHPCFLPGKDLLIPLVQLPEDLAASPLLGAAPVERDIFFFLRGDVGRGRQPNYSRGIRQRLYRLAREGGWREKHNVIIDDWQDSNETYGQLLARSTFCAAVPGDGYSRRFEDAVLHGCLPVIIMDDVDEKFSTAVDLSAFAVLVAEADIDKVLEILLAIPSERILGMQRALGLVWHRFRYTALPVYLDQTRLVMAGNSARKKLGDAPRSEPGIFDGDAGEDDAFATIMQWLYARIPDTR